MEQILNNETITTEPQFDEQGNLIVAAPEGEEILVQTDEDIGGTPFETVTVH